MSFYLDLFSPETYEAFSRSDRRVSGFRSRQRAAATRIKPGDKLVCYMTKLSRWVGVLEVIEGPYEDKTPIFYPEDDPFVIRFKVNSIVWLPKEKTLPIHLEEIWSALSFTKGQDPTTSNWTGKLRGSLVRISDQDGSLLEVKLLEQIQSDRSFEVNEQSYHRLLRHRVRTPDGLVTVSVPSETDVEEVRTEAETRESTKVQALIAKIGATMGMRIWLPKSDRLAVSKEWTSDGETLLNTLPLNYDESTLRTIEQIDVLWLKRRSIVRAFEVEHTTSIYSGILRMADLLALQPNMDINLHIVAPSERRDKVFQEITRPVFSLLESGPLSERCTYISYESIRELAQLKHLEHLSDSVLDEYTEDTE
ncbi:MAG TPA: EVE domain-containing protein [Thermoanaerobaculia bacterium]|nr:EVE domain-containing protein [Thermoanaerobaculia bacterium]